MRHGVEPAGLGPGCGQLAPEVMSPGTEPTQSWASAGKRE